MASVITVTLSRKSALKNVCVLLLILLFASVSRAQMGGVDNLSDRGLGGNNRIEGRVYYPSNRPVDRRLRVRISSVRGGDSFLMTDDNGAFTARRLVPGTYNITVEAGTDYEAGYETAEFISNRSGQVINVEIRLRYKRGVESKPAILNAALANIPKPAVEIYEKAVAAAQAGNSKKAIEQLKNAIQIYPRFALALNVLGVQYMRLNQFGEAAAAFRDAITINPDAYLPRFNLAMALLQQKKYAEAEAEFSRALAKNDASSGARLYRGRTLIYLKRYDEAEKELRRVISLSGGEAAMAHRYLGALYKEQGKNKRAVEELERYLKLVPGAKDAAQIREIINQLRAQAVTQ